MVRKCVCGCLLAMVIVSVIAVFVPAECASRHNVGASGVWHFDFVDDALQLYWHEYPQELVVDAEFLDKAKHESGYCGFVKCNTNPVDYANFLYFFGGRVTWKVPGQLCYMIFDPQLITSDPTNDLNLVQFRGWLMTTARSQLVLPDDPQGGARRMFANRATFLFWCGYGNNPILHRVDVTSDRPLELSPRENEAVIIVSFRPMEVEKCEQIACALPPN